MPPLSDFGGFRTLFNASPNAYLLLDRDLTIVEVNEAFLEVTGRAREELVDRNFFDAFPGDPDVADDRNVRRLQSSLEHVLSTGETDSLALLPYTVPRTISQEETTYERRYWSVVHTPIVGEGEDVEFILQHITDVSKLYKEESEEQGKSREDVERNERGAERREKDPLEQAADAGVERIGAAVRDNWASKKGLEGFRRVFGQPPGFVAFLSGADHVFEMASDTYYQLVGDRDIIGKPVRKALPEVSGQGCIELLDRVYESGEVLVGNKRRLRLRRGPGEELETVYLDFVFQPITGPEGKVNGILVPGRDVTERVHAEMKVRQVQKRTANLALDEQRERRRIARVLHDDLQQRFYGIQLQMSSLQDVVKSRGHDALLGRVQRMKGQMVEAVRAMRRLSVGVSPPVLETEGLTAALEWLRSHMEKTHGLEVDLKAEREFSVEEERQLLLFQVVRELLSNVAEHADVDRATVRLEGEENLVIRVIDRGRGFDPEVVDPCGVESQEGGFGLIAARERVRSFGGELSVESTPGKGTEATVRLPME